MNMPENNGAAAGTSTPRRPWSGRLSFYHPTSTGNGAAAQFEFHPAQQQRDGCFFMEMARQKTAPTREPGGRQAATFDWENKITVKLDFTDVCQLLLVLEGQTTQAGNGRGGLFHDTAAANTVINLRREAEVPGCALEVSRKAKQAEATVQRARVVLSAAECLGLRCVFQSAMFPLVFGAMPCT